MNESFRFLCRSRLRYSWSYLTIGFVQFVVPELKKRMHTVELNSSTLDNSPEILATLETCYVLIIPRKQFIFEFCYPFVGANLEPAEYFEGVLPVCSHIFLKYRFTGMAVDVSLG